VIGASAGYLAALTRLAVALPSQLPAAIFVVIHRSTTHFLTEILSNKARMPVRLAADEEPFEFGNLYVCPADQYLSLENGIIRVEHSPKDSIYRPSLNALFRSAALAYGKRVVGVVLTGMLDDGSAGLWQIKKRGGVAIVQDPLDAQFPAMPESAIANVSVDYILPIEGIAQKLVELTGYDPNGDLYPPKAVNVLIVEDDRVVAANLQEHLDDLGYSVQGPVASGEEAMALIAESEPNVVLMDIHLAGHLTGVQVARRIWEQYQIPVIYVTAYADPVTLQHVKTTEAYGYIVKPFHCKAVETAIELALDRREKELR
jgi:chemotaxis response regulator CheB